MSSCKLYPTIKDKEGNLKESELYKQLLSYTKDRELTNAVYSIVTDNVTKEQFNYELDEPTLESVVDKLNLEALVSDKAKTNTISKTLNSKVNHDSIEEVLDQIVEFNNDSQNYTASLKKENDKFKIEVSVRNDQNTKEAKKLESSVELNKFLIKLLNKVGVAVDNNIATHGIFDPSNAYTTAEGLKTLISIANNESGQDALPEEFSHFIIAALGNEPLVRRLLNYIASPEAVKHILGDKYEVYNKLYDGNMEKLIKEAAGHLLMNHLKNEEVIPQIQPLLHRIWNRAKQIFKKVKTTDVDYALAQANQIASNIALQIKDETILPLINTEQASKDVTLRATDQTTEYLKSVLEGIIKNKLSHAQVYANRKKSAKYLQNEKVQIEELQKLLDKEQFIKGISSFLKDTGGLIKQSKDRISLLYKDGQINVGELPTQFQSVAGLLRDIHNFVNSYSDTLLALSDADVMTKRKELNLNQEEADAIASSAKELIGVIKSIKKDYDKVSLVLFEKLMRPLFGEDKVMKYGKYKGMSINLHDVLTSAPQDINWFRQMLDSAADSGDLCIELFDKMIKIQKDEFKEKTIELTHKVAELHEILKNAGVTNTEFMFEKDENGVPTLFYISDRDNGKYQADKEAKIKELQEADISDEERDKQLSQWIRSNTETKMIRSSATEFRYERIPSITKYPSQAMSKLNQAQLEYYNKFMQYKIELDNLLPPKTVYMFKAVQDYNSTSEAMMNDHTLKDKANTFMGDMGDRIFRRETDDEFGERVIAKDFTGNEIKKLPIFYTSLLQDKNRLSLDASSSLVKYGAMVYNYDAMFQIIDVVELGRDLMKNRDIKQWNGTDKLIAKIKAFGKELQEDFTKKGGDKLVQRYNDLVDMQVYGQMKLDEGVFSLLGKEIDKAKLADTVASLTSMQTLGLNFFSSINNVTMGKFQMMMEGIGGEYFNYKHLMQAEKDYFSLLPEYLNEIGSNVNSSKLGLLIEKYDVFQDYDKEAKDKNYHKNGILKVFGKGGVFFMSSAGEHYLQSKLALAFLNAHKVLLNGKEISLIDAYEVNKKVVGGKVVNGSLVLKEGVTNLDGSKFTETDRYNLQMKMAKINQSLNGIYNNADKSAIQRYSLGRLGILYRKWMVPHYNRRFRSAYFDLQLGQEREGVYNTGARFIGEIYKELKQGQFNVGVLWDTLDAHEKGNIKRALTEIGSFLVISLLLFLMGSYTDKDTWAGRVAQYELRRMHLELGTSFFAPMMVTEGMTVLQSPSAAMKSIGNIAETLNAFDLFKEVDKGTYKGHSVYYRNFIQNMPLVGNIAKISNIQTDDNMFKYLPQVFMSKEDSK